MGEVILAMPEKPGVTQPGTVDKIIPAVSSKEADTVHIGLDTPHDLYREVRIDNTLTNESGGKVSLEPGEPVEVTITAEAGSTTISSHIPVSQKL